MAIKVFKPEAVNREYVRHCLDKLRTAAPHPGIIPIHDHDLGGDPAYCVMALHLDYRQDPPEPQTIEALCGEVSENDGWLLVAQLAEAMTHAHSLGIVHCGLKTSNVFFDDDGERVTIQVSDFGQGWLGGVGRLALNDHTFYASPEQLAHPEQLFEKDVRTWDVYAFGAVAYRLLTGYFPRFEDELDQLRQRIEEDPNAPIVFDPGEYAANATSYPEILWPDSLDPAQSQRRAVIDRCLALSPEDRYPDMASVKEALRAASSMPSTTAPVETALLAGDESDPDSGGSAPEYPHATVAPHPTEPSHPQEEQRPAGPMSSLVRLVPWALVIALIAVAGALYSLYSGTKSKLADANAELASHQGKIIEYSGELADKTAQEEQTATLVAESTLEAGAAREEKLRAQRNLAKAQDTADFFFTEFIEGGSEKADTPERKIAFERAEQFYLSVLASAEDDPDLLDSVARATLNLARIQNGLGKTDDAEVGYGKAIDSISQLIDKNPESPAADDHRLRLAKARLSAAKLSLSRGNFEEGLELLEQAGEQYRPFADRLATDPALRHTVAEVYQLTGWVLRELERPDDAMAQQGRTIELLAHAEENPNNAPNDALLLSKAYFERGRCRLVKSELDDGASDHVKAVDMLLELHDLDPDAPTYRFQLGSNYWALGEMLAASGIWNQAGQAHSEAVKYLKSLVEQFPNASVYKMALARDYAAVARLLRDQGSPERALDYQRGTVVFINEVVTKSGASDLDRHELAVNRGLYAELLATAGKVPDAVNEARQGVTMAEEIRIKQAAGSHLRKKFQISLAQLYGTLGDVAEKSENKEEAVTSFKKAVETWEQLKTAGHSDEAIEKGLGWSTERLATLDPEALQGDGEEDGEEDPEAE